MLILAIDTALDACAAVVLDTDKNKVIALESQAMKPRTRRKSFSTRPTLRP